VGGGTRIKTTLRGADAALATSNARVARERTTHAIAHRIRDGQAKRRTWGLSRPLCIYIPIMYSLAPFTERSWRAPPG